MILMTAIYYLWKKKNKIGTLIVIYWVLNKIKIQDLNIINRLIN